MFPNDAGPVDWVTDTLGDLCEIFSLRLLFPIKGLFGLTLLWSKDWYWGAAQPPGIQYHLCFV